MCALFITDKWSYNWTTTSKTPNFKFIPAPSL